MKKRGLGRGFDSLLPSVEKEENKTNKNEDKNIKQTKKNSIKNNKNEEKKINEKLEKSNKNVEKIEDKEILIEIDINKIHPDRNQPRKNFEEEKIRELAESIKNHGLIQPITVVKDENDDSYTIVAGERRWRASRLAKQNKIKCIVKNLNEVQRLFEAIIENVMRKDLNIIEEAKAYERLLDEYSVTHEKLSEMIGKSRSSLSNILRLLNLASGTQKYLMEEKITLGHAKVLLQIEDNDLQELYASKVAEASLSVRDLENLIKKYKENKKETKVKVNVDILSQINLHIREIQNQFSKVLGTKVRIKSKENDLSTGEIVIKYKTKEELEDIAKVFGIEELG